jgi:hypothetical protein
MEDDTGLPLTNMILDFTCEQWVEKYRVFIHCTCRDSQERRSDRNWMTGDVLRDRAQKKPKGQLVEQRRALQKCF